MNIIKINGEKFNVIKTAGCTCKCCNNFIIDAIAFHSDTTTSYICVNCLTDAKKDGVNTVNSVESTPKKNGYKVTTYITIDGNVSSNIDLIGKAVKHGYNVNSVNGRRCFVGEAYGFNQPSALIRELKKYGVMYTIKMDVNDTIKGLKIYGLDYIDKDYLIYKKWSLERLATFRGI